MKHKHVLPAARRILAAALSLSLVLSPAFAAAGTGKVQTTWTLARGLSYLDTVTQHDAGGRVESFSLELGADSTAYPILLQGSGTIYGSGTINRAVTLAQEMGYHVLGAMNADFFAVSNGVPLGIVIENGIYKSSPGEENAVCVSDNRFYLSMAPRVTLTLTNHSREDRQTTLHNLNKSRAPTGGLYLFNQYFSTVSTRTGTPGWMVRMRELDGEELTLSGELRLEVTELLRTEESAVIGEGEYILTADDENGMGETFESFQLGDQITLTARTEDPNLPQAQWAGGAGDVLLLEGQMPNDISGWIYAKDGRQPRSALGVRRDGSAVLYVADGRRGSYSVGLSEEDLAQELQRQNCVWAVNLDGGGSSAMSVWVPGKSGPELVNRPSDGVPRGCATYLLLVTDQEGDGRPSQLAPAENGLVVLSGSSAELGSVSVLDSGLNPLAYDPGELSVTSRSRLGTVSDGVYTAGETEGTDTLDIYSAGLNIWGTQQIHVVRELTELTVSREGTSDALTGLNLKPGQQVRLTASGSYWSYPAMRDSGLVSWEVRGNVGTIDASGLFTAAMNGGTGSIVASAGGQSRTVEVTLTDAHQDVTQDHWAYVAVEYCYEQGLVSGISATRFGPDENIRRGDFVLMLYRMAGNPAVTSQAGFADVSPKDYYATAVDWAREKNLVSGVSETDFAPTVNVTREQAFVILDRVLPLLNISCPQADVSVLERFRDVGDMAGWAAPFAATLVENQIVGGSGDYINPKGSLSRAEMAALLYKLGHFEPQTVVPDGEKQPDQAGPADVSEQDTAEQREMAVQPGGDGLREAAEQADSFAVDAAVSADISVLNVRAGPGVEYEILDRLAAGDGVQVLERLESGWLRIRFRNQEGNLAEGYVSGDYIVEIRI